VPVSQEYLEYILDLLKTIGPVNSRRMFGGAGIYHESVFFCLVADDTHYFKVDDRNRTDYEAAGSGPFKPFGSYAMSYYEVPADVLEDNDRLQEWAMKAISAAGKRMLSASNRTSRGRQ
jgi:DNA transformation protein